MKEIHNMPVVEQLLEIQKLGVVLAKDQDGLRESEKSNAHLFLAKQLEGYAFSELDSTPYYWTHRFTGRTAKVGFRSWSMRVVEAFWVQDETNGHNDGFRNSYQFEWNHHSVVKAVRVGRVRKVDPFENLIETGCTTPDLLLGDGMDVTVSRHRVSKAALNLLGVETEASTKPFEPALENAVQQTNRVSQADCDRLIKDMRIFSGSSRIAFEEAEQTDPLWNDLYLFNY